MKDFSQSDEAAALLHMPVSDKFEARAAVLMYSQAGAVAADAHPGIGTGVTAPSWRPGQPGFYAKFGKRALDVALVLLSAPITVPLVLLFAALLWATGGKPFYFQKRLGKDQNVFEIVKLRSMVLDADRRLEECLETDPKIRAEWDTKQKLENDPRITRLGRFLRATSMDELPQLFNVLRGDMSLVGPRPMMLDQLEKYGNPRSYFALRPGITGVWQVSGRNETAFAYRNVLDAKYRATLTFVQDVALLWKTVGVVLKRTGK